MLSVAAAVPLRIAVQMATDASVEPGTGASSSAVPAAARDQAKRVDHGVPCAGSVSFKFALNLESRDRGRHSYRDSSLRILVVAVPFIQRGADRLLVGRARAGVLAGGALEQYIGPINERPFLETPAACRHVDEQRHEHAQRNFRLLLALVVACGDGETTASARGGQTLA